MTRHAAPDALTEKLIEKALAPVDINDLRVSVVSGTPHIEGTVCGLRDKRRAAQIVTSLRDGRVVNRLRVAPNVIREDEAVARAVRDRLGAVVTGGGCTVHVACRKGIVHLSGAVDSPAARLASERAARLVHGVTNVFNRIRVGAG